MQVHRVVADTNVVLADELKDNRRVTLKEIASVLEISYGSVSSFCDGSLLA